MAGRRSVAPTEAERDRAAAIAESKAFRVRQTEDRKSRIPVRVQCPPSAYKRFLEICEEYDRKPNEQAWLVFKLGLEYYDARSVPNNAPRVFDHLPELREPDIRMREATAEGYVRTATGDHERRSVAQVDGFTPPSYTHRDDHPVPFDEGIEEPQAEDEPDDDIEVPL